MIFGLLIAVGITVFVSQSFGYEVNVYDSVSDKTKVVVEYVDNSNRSHKLIVKKDELETRYLEVEQWTLKISKSEM